MKNKITFATIAIILAVVAIAGIIFSGLKSGGDQKENALKELRLDYANWSPISLVVRQQKFLEKEFEADGTKITWIFSQGSNKSMEFLRSRSIDIGSSAGVAAFISFSNGNPIKTVYISSTPEWTALLVKPGSEVTSVAQLKGATIAATPGTDPYVFLVRTLQANNLTLQDVNVVTLQHPDGKNELLRGRVDAWAGLDPLMAQAELAGAKYLFRNVDFNSYNVISVRRDFAEAHPDAVKRVLSAYEQGREWAKTHPAEFLELVASEAKITPEVAALLIQRTGLNDSAFTGKQEKAIIEAGKALQAAGIIKNDRAAEELAGELIDHSFFPAPTAARQ